jgi:hypothetical protein
MHSSLQTQLDTKLAVQKSPLAFQSESDPRNGTIRVKPGQMILYNCRILRKFESPPLHALPEKPSIRFFVSFRLTNDITNIHAHDFERCIRNFDVPRMPHGLRPKIYTFAQPQNLLF